MDSDRTEEAEEVKKKESILTEKEKKQLEYDNITDKELLQKNVEEFYKKIGFQKVGNVYIEMEL